MDPHHRNFWIAFIIFVLIVVFAVLIYSVGTFRPSNLSSPTSTASTGGSRLPPVSIEPPARRGGSVSSGAPAATSAPAYTPPESSLSFSQLFGPLQAVPFGGAGSVSGAGGGAAAPQGGGTAATSAEPSAPQVAPADIPPGFTASQLSPWFHLVRFGSVYPGGFGATGQVSLTAGFSDPNLAADVTGWSVQGNRGGYYIPQAANAYQPFGVTPDSDIVMKDGDGVYVYSGGSTPIGQNVRLNKCLGYLPTASSFDPQLPFDCPVPSQSDVSNFSGQCQDYITSLAPCQIPDSNPPVPESDDACRSYISAHLNYAGCFNGHRGDSDFLEHQVWVWAGSDFLDSRHDQVKLYDGAHRLVDYYSY